MKFCETKPKDNGKKRGKDSNSHADFFCSNSIEANEESVLILDEETEDGVEIEILDR